MTKLSKNFNIFELFISSELLRLLKNSSFDRLGNFRKYSSTENISKNEQIAENRYTYQDLTYTLSEGTRECIFYKFSSEHSTTTQCQNITNVNLRSLALIVIFSFHKKYEFSVNNFIVKISSKIFVNLSQNRHIIILILGVNCLYLNQLLKRSLTFL